jgi:predicted phosphate transport protein (TIGR00153 family)
MMSWFVPREAKFFDMFRDTSNFIVDGAKELQAMIGDLGHVEERAKRIKEIEHSADTITYQAVEALHKTFITPLDRDDMFRLVTKLDDIMDYIDAASQRFHLFDIRTATPEVLDLARIILLSAERIRDAVSGLQNMKNSSKIIEFCVEINRLENEADHVMRVGMAKLFREEIGYKDLIKLKEILELLESVTDRCKDVANIIEGIVLDHA